MSLSFSFDAELSMVPAAESTRPGGQQRVWHALGRTGQDRAASGKAKQGKANQEAFIPGSQNSVRESGLWLLGGVTPIGPRSSGLSCWRDQSKQIPALSCAASAFCLPSAPGISSSAWVLPEAFPGRARPPTLHGNVGALGLLFFLAPSREPSPRRGSRHPYLVLE